MKKLRNYIMIAGVILLGLSLRLHAAGEGKTTLERLMAYEWESQNPQVKQKQMTYVWKFYADSRATTMVHGGQSATVKDPFYLSDTPETEFDESKVGKVNNGKYIIEKNRQSQVIIREIVKLDCDELIVKGYSSRQDAVYKAIK